MNLRDPLATGIRATLYKVVLLAILFEVFAWIIGHNPKAAVPPNWIGVVFAYLLLLVEFPVSLLHCGKFHINAPSEMYIHDVVYPTALLVNPLIWGLAGNWIHGWLMKHKPSPPANAD